MTSRSYDPIWRPRLGHSIDVLLRVYAGVLIEERERSNEMNDAELERVLGS